MSTAQARAFHAEMAPTVRRAAFLTQALEPARIRGTGTPTALAYSFGEFGDARMAQIMGQVGGTMAPMTQPGASASQPRTREQRLAVRARHRRIGAIFRHLLTEAKKVEMFVDVETYRLNDLADAVQGWLRARVLGQPNLEQYEAVLVQEIKLFLRAYHGRG